MEESLVLHTDKNINNASTILEESLIKLANSLKVSINTDEVIYSLFVTITIEDNDPNSHYILFDPNLFFVSFLEKMFPDLNAIVKSLIENYRMNLNLLFNEAKTNKLIYTLFVFWDQLFINLKTIIPKASVIIFSDQHYTHANIIKQVLEEEISFPLEIDIYKEQMLNEETIKSLDYDIYISTFPLPQVEDEYLIVFESFPTNTNIQLVKNTLSNQYANLDTSKWKIDFWK